MPVQLPNYQRDFAWDSKKMNQLWDDLLHYVFKNPQQAKSTKPSQQHQYFLGAIVRDVGDSNFLVDGQQRFTTLHLIACALRDALISKGHYEKALQLHKNIIIDFSDDDDPRNRFTLLDVPPKHILSAETRMAPFRMPLVNIRTGMVTKKTKVGETEVLLNSNPLNWTLPKQADWKFRLWDEQNKKWYSKKIYSVWHRENNRFFFQFGNTPKSIIVSSRIRKKIPSGLEIVLIPEIMYPEEEPMGIITSVEGKRNLNRMARCSVFDPTNREFYLKVRITCEHFIRGYKEFTPAGGIKEENASTSLKIVPSAEGEIARSARELEKGEILEFSEVHSDPGWPSTEEIKEIIRGGAEEKFVEFKGGWKHRAKGSYHQRNTRPPSKPKVKQGKISDLMIEQAAIAIASFMNTAGGLLLVGVQDSVRDSGRVMGINRDFEIINGELDPEAPRKFNEKMKKYFGNHIHFVDFKPYKVDEIHWIMACKVRKAPTQKEIKATKKWCEFEGRRLRPAENMTPTRETQQSYKLKPGDKEEFADISDYFIDVFGATYGEETVLRKVVVRKYKSNKSGISIPQSSKTSLLTSVATIKDGELFDKKEISDYSICKVSYLGKKEDWPSHLNNETDRAKQLVWLIQNTCFSSIEFRNKPEAAISHFMLTNDPERVSPLNAYDLVSSMTQKIIAPDQDGKPPNKYQKEIANHWSEISQKLYISTGKNETKINDYFSDFLLCTMRTKTGSQRYGKKETWSGLENEFSKRTSLNGEFDYRKLAEFYFELKSYTSSYIRAVDHDSDLWGNKPYTLAECRDERTYLYALHIGGAKQILPVYMALSGRVEKEDASREIIRNFLKNFNYLWLRIFMLKALIPNKPTFIQPNQIYGKMTGSESWIKQIWGANLASEDDVKRIQELPLEMINEVDDDELNRKIPWVKNHQLWEELNFDGEKNSKQIKHILVSIERALEIGENPQMSQIHGPGTKVHVEHVLPQEPQNWGGIWYKDGEKTLDHKMRKYMLGNHCLLEDSLNSSIRNAPPVEKAESIKSSKCVTARKVAELIRVSGTWGDNEISNFSTEMMNSLIEFYDY